MSVSAVSWWSCGGDHKRKTCQFLESAVGSVEEIIRGRRCQFRQSAGGSVEEIIRGRPVSFCSQLVDLWRRS